MLTFPLVVLTSMAVALARSALAAPTETQPALLKRATGATIVTTSNPNSCLGVETLINGAGLVAKDCATNNPSSSTPFYNKWDISPGNNKVVRLSGLPPGCGDFCLDAGNLSGDLRAAKIWKCYPGLDVQQWYYTNDKHIAITGGKGCLESGRYGIVYQKCAATSSAGTQTFNIVGGNKPPAGKPIKWLLKGREKCLTVATGKLANGAALTIHDCFDASSEYYALQQFLYNTGSTKIRVAPTRLGATEYCVDFGSKRGVNGVRLKIWKCYNNLPAQQLWITGDNHIAVEGDNQCADVRAQSHASSGQPYGSLKDLQSWQCSGGDPHQIFRFSF